MLAPIKQIKEAERLEDLYSYQILDSKPEPGYDDITAFAAEICNTPISLITLVDEDRQWFKSFHGIDFQETPRNISFCAQAILSPEDVCLVQDTMQDERFKTNPFVTANPNVRFYAGVPLTSLNGHRLGTLCVVDLVPRQLSNNQSTALQKLAKHVVSLLELRKSNLALEKTYQLLETKYAELEQFNFLASHDLQEPLRTISSYSSFLNENYKDHLDEVGQKSLGFIASASSRMSSLIKGLLDSSHIGQEKIITAIDCYQILEEIQLDYRDLIEKTKATIEIGELPTIMGSSIAIRLLFQNLICNALKFRSNDTPPLIRISAETHKDSWEFSVSDNGIGIDKQYKDRIFKMFQRLHTSSEYKGHGIGLAHCQKIVESHGGTISFQSTLGQGTTFHFTIAIEK